MITSSWVCNSLKSPSGCAVSDAEAQVSQGPTPLSPCAFCDTCPEPSAARAALPEAPEMQLGQNCSSADVGNGSHHGSSSWLPALMRGQGRTWGVRVGPSLGSVQHELLLCSCCSSSPGSGVQHHLYSDFWCSDEAVFSVLRY